MQPILAANNRQIMVSDACYYAISAAVRQGKRLEYCDSDMPAMPNACPNCHGTKTITFTAARQQIMWQSPSARPEYLSFACPKCSQDAEAEAGAHLLRQSGLLPVEYDWQVDYAAGRAGKLLAIRTMKRQFVEQLPRPWGWVSLVGRHGVGKSGLLKATVAQLCKGGVEAVYRRAIDILIEAEADFGPEPDWDGKGEQAIKAKYGSCPFLAVDEIDQVQHAERFMALLFSILDERYNRRRQQGTAVASSRPASELGPAFQFLEDKMRDGEQVVMAGGSLRGKGRGPAKRRKKMVARAGARSGQWQ